MTLREAIKQIGASWKQELKTQSPAHILKQAINTAYLLPALLLVMLYARVRRLAVIGYRYLRHYYFVALIDLEYGPGTYARESEYYSRTKNRTGSPRLNATGETLTE